MERGVCKLCLLPIFYLDSGVWSHMTYIEPDVDHKAFPMSEGV
jgi:hypothetical protein